MNTKRWGLLVLLIGSVLTSGAALTQAEVPHVAREARVPDNVDRGSDTRSSDRLANADPFSFVVTADMRYYSGPGSYDSSRYFRGAVEAINGLGQSTFMVSPGDIDPPAGVLWTITRTLGISYTWYPVIGNHDRPGDGQEAGYGANLNWLHSYDYGPAVNPGPPGCPQTTYSFDYQNAHFVMLNVYCDSSGPTATSGDVPDYLYDWLANDLSNTTQPHIFVFGHEPAYPQPDADNGRLRHSGDSLDQHPSHRDRFWNLLRDMGVVAYICGHTHNFSALELDGVWQLDAGHARGMGDTGARSTFILIRVDGGEVTFEAYRDDAHGGPYGLRFSGTLVSPPLPHLSMVKRATPGTGPQNDVLTYTLTISGPGLTVSLVDALPLNVEYVPNSVTPPAVYSPTLRAIIWQGMLPADQVQVFRFQVTSSVLLSPTVSIVNTAWLTDAEHNRSIFAHAIVNGRRLYLPLIVRRH